MQFKLDYLLSQSQAHTQGGKYNMLICAVTLMSVCVQSICANFKEQKQDLHLILNILGKAALKANFPNAFFTLHWKFLNYSKTPTLCKIAQYCVPLSHILLTFDISIGVFYKNKLSAAQREMFF